MIDLTLERYHDLLRQGTIFIDEMDPSEKIRSLVILEHSISDASITRSGSRRIVSRRMQFVEISEDGIVHSAGYAPYLDYRSPQEDEIPILDDIGIPEWIARNLEEVASDYAIQHLVPEHLAEVRRQREPMIDKTLKAVHDRLNP